MKVLDVVVHHAMASSTTWCTTLMAYAFVVKIYNRHSACFNRARTMCFGTVSEILRRSRLAMSGNVSGGADALTVQAGTGKIIHRSLTSVATNSLASNFKETRII